MITGMVVATIPVSNKSLCVSNCYVKIINKLLTQQGFSRARSIGLAAQESRDVEQVFLLRPGRRLAQTGRRSGSRNRRLG